MLRTVLPPLLRRRTEATARPAADGFRPPGRRSTSSSWRRPQGRCTGGLLASALPRRRPGGPTDAPAAQPAARAPGARPWPPGRRAKARPWRRAGAGAAGAAAALGTRPVPPLSRHSARGRAPGREHSGNLLPGCWPAPRSRTRRSPS
ncbi:hypothetical protein LV779_14180 [Streptomyces thinghirensis]|nr:hypothetical protein [Streptomyces thinghirensis]